MAVANPDQAGRELVRAEATSPQTTIQTLTDLTGLTITFTTDGPTIVELHIPYMTHTTAGNGGSVFITDAANTISSAQAGAQAHANGASMGPINVVEYIAAAGTYTRKARASAGVASMSMIAGVNPSNPGPAYIRAVRV